MNEEKMSKYSIENLKLQLRKRVMILNMSFNRFSKRIQKLFLILFGLTIGSICVILIGRALIGEPDIDHLSVDKIQTPNNQFMQRESTPLSEEDLVPIGKMKGMIEGEYEAFYVAVDKDGKVYINRDISYSADAYKKSNGWENIKKEQLDEYEKELHFIPNRTKGLKF
jgi:hypothetical protein